MLCTCPPGAAIVDIPTADCLEAFGQIQKLIFQRRLNGTVINSISNFATNDPTLLATWTPFFSANDATKMQITPFLEEVVSTPGEVREADGGDVSLNGIASVRGANPSTFTARFSDLQQKVVDVLIDNYMCEKDLVVFLVNEHGQIAGKTTNIASPDDFYGFPIQSLFVSDKGFGNYANVDRNNIRFLFPPRFSRNLHIITPVFDPKTDLVN